MDWTDSSIGEATAAAANRERRRAENCIMNGDTGCV
jgi:hypothetical protein